MKFLNKLFLPAFVLALVFSCDPLQDEFDAIDKAQEEEGVDIKLTYTLTSDDYATIADIFRSFATVADSATADFVEDMEAFNPSIDMSAAVGEFINDKYSQFGKGASVKVSYNFFNSDMVPDHSMYLDASTYSLTDADYASVNTTVGDAGFFYPSAPASSSLPAILASSVQNAVDGDVYAVSYKASSEDANLDYSTAGVQTVFTEAFATGTYNAAVDGYFAQSVVGDQSWVWRDYSGDGYAYMSGYASGAQDNEDWFVIEDVDLSDYSEATLSVYQAVNYMGAQVFGEDIAIKVSTDFDGSDVTTATWTNLTPDVWPGGTSWTFVTSEMDLTAFAGETIAIAFAYKSTTSDAPGWEVSTVTVTAPGAGPTLLSKAPVYHTDYYEFDGSSWDALDGVYTLTADDYNAMGAPGQYDNFSSSAAPGDYLPGFLTSMFPYAQEGDQYVLVYKYYSGGVKTIAETYTFEGGMWLTQDAWAESFYSEESAQFVHNGTAFLFNPSVTFTMVSADYQIIVDQVKSSHPDLVDSYGTGEFYYGAGAYYSNFDLGYTSRSSGDYAQDEYADLSESEAKELMIQRMGEGIQVLLEVKHADAKPIDGIEILYTVYSASYDGANGSWVTVFTVSGNGQFELVEGPTQQ